MEMKFPIAMLLFGLLSSHTPLDRAKLAETNTQVSHGFARHAYALVIQVRDESGVPCTHRSVTLNLRASITAAPSAGRVNRSPQSA
jgi:hypothetical protein